MLEISGLETARSIDLVSIRNESVWTNSLIIADRFGKEHKNVLMAIRNLECSEEFGRLNFKPSSYINEQGKEQPMYNISRDGAMFLIMGFTGPEAARWKERFIQAFNEAEQRLSIMAPDIDIVGKELISLRPFWAEIRDLTLEGKTLDQIVEVVPMSRSAIGRARERMRDLGLVNKAPLYRRRELETLLARKSLENLHLKGRSK